MKYLSFLFFCFLFSVKSHSQVEYEAYIIGLAGDTLNGRIQIPVKKGTLDFMDISNKIRFADTVGFKTYKPHEINGFGIKEEGLSGDYLSFQVEKKTLFLKKVTLGYWQIYDDVISLYKSFTGPTYNGATGFRNSTYNTKWGDGKDYYILYKNKPVKLERKPASGYLNLKQLKEIFSEHPAILNKLTAEMQWFQLVEIIEEFNKHNPLL